MRGRSFDFEDLRPYDTGDEVRDIDWRATARAGEPMVRRSFAERRHRVLFVVDTGAAMTALARDDEPKSRLALLAVGALATLAVRHGDDVQLMYAENGRARRLAPRSSMAGIEQLLQTMNGAIAQAQRSSERATVLTAVARTVRRRGIVVVVSDEAAIDGETEGLLRRLRAQHDVLWVTLRDADPVMPYRGAGIRRDVATGWGVPDFLQGDPAIVAELAANRVASDRRRAALLGGLEIDEAVLDGADTMVTRLLEMLQRRAHARR